MVQSALHELDPIIDGQCRPNAPLESSMSLHIDTCVEDGNHLQAPSIHMKGKKVKVLHLKRLTIANHPKSSIRCSYDPAKSCA